MLLVDDGWTKGEGIDCFDLKLVWSELLFHVQRRIHMALRRFILRLDFNSFILSVVFLAAKDERTDCFDLSSCRDVVRFSRAAENVVLWLHFSSFI